MGVVPRLGHVHSFRALFRNEKAALRAHGPYSLSVPWRTCDARFVRLAYRMPSQPAPTAAMARPSSNDSRRTAPPTKTRAVASIDIEARNASMISPSPHQALRCDTIVLNEPIRPPSTLQLIER